MFALAALFLIAPSPLLFLAPLTGLLLVGGPITWLEAGCLVASAGISVGLLALSHGIAAQTVNAMAILLAGAFILLNRGSRPAGWGTALRALGVALVALMLWSRVWGITWHDLEWALTRRWWAWCRNLSAAAYLLDLSDGVRNFVERLANGGRTYARMFPLWLAATGLMGLLLAGFWHRRITGKPDHL